MVNKLLQLLLTLLLSVAFARSKPTDASCAVQQFIFPTLTTGDSKTQSLSLVSSESAKAYCKSEGFKDAIDSSSMSLKGLSDLVKYAEDKWPSIADLVTEDSCSGDCKVLLSVQCTSLPADECKKDNGLQKEVDKALSCLADSEGELQDVLLDCVYDEKDKPRGGLVLGSLLKMFKCSTRKNCKESSWKCIDGKYECDKCQQGFELKNGRCKRSGGGGTATTIDLPSVTAQVTLSGFTEATFDEAAQTAFKNAVRTAAALAAGYPENFITVIIRSFGNTSVPFPLSPPGKILSNGNRRRHLLDGTPLLDVIFSTTFEGAIVANSFAELQAITAQSEQGAIIFIATLQNNIATVFPVQIFGGAILIGEPVISTEVIEIEANFPVPTAPAPPTNVQNVGTSPTQWTGSWTAAAESRPLTYSTKCVDAGDSKGCFGTTRGVGQSLLTTLTGQVFGLTPGTAYDCFAISVLVGDNLAKCSAPVRYTTAALAAGKPTEVTTDKLISDTTNWYVEWKDGTVGVSQETYTLKCVTKDAADGCEAAAVKETTGIVRGTESGQVDGLTSGTDYDCYVIAVNVADSVCSDKVAFTTLSCSCDTSQSGTGFTGFTNGPIGGQFGWTTQDAKDPTTRTTPDEAILEVDSSQVWRISNAPYSTSPTSTGTITTFAAQPYSPSSSKPAGEVGMRTAALWNDYFPNLSLGKFGEFAESKCFCGGFNFKSATGATQAPLIIGIAPSARQSSNRNGLVRLTDNGTDGFTLSVFDVVDSAFRTVAIPASVTGLDYINWHRITIQMEFVEGYITTNVGGTDVFTGNDIVKVFVDGVPVYVGTSWEGFWVEESLKCGTLSENASFCTNPPDYPRLQAVDSLIFRPETATAGNQGNGFYFDYVTVST